MAAPNGNGKSGIVRAILGYVDRPWKALFITVVVVLLGLGWLVHERPEYLKEIVDRGRSPLHLRSDADLVGTIDYFFAGFNVDGVGIWEANLAANLLILRVARLRDGTPWKIGPSPTSFAGADKDKRILIALIRGEPACADPKTLPSAIAKSAVASGMVYLCYVPEPPSHLHMTAAMVVLGWKTAPSAPLVDAALAVVEQSTKHILR